MSKVNPTPARTIYRPIAICLGVVCVFAACFFLHSKYTTSQRFVLVETDGTDKIHNGSGMIYQGVRIGSVESVELTGAGNMPVAKVILLPGSPPLVASDVFRISASGLLGDPYIEVIPGASQSALLRNGATVRLRDLPIQRDEALGKIQKFIDEVKKEPASTK